MLCWTKQNPHTQHFTAFLGQCGTDFKVQIFIFQSKTKRKIVIFSIWKLYEFKVFKKGYSWGLILINPICLKWGSKIAHPWRATETSARWRHTAAELKNCSATSRDTNVKITSWYRVTRILVSFSTGWPHNSIKGWYF